MKESSIKIDGLPASVVGEMVRRHAASRTAAEPRRHEVAFCRVCRATRPTAEFLALESDRHGFVGVCNPCEKARRP